MLTAVRLPQQGNKQTTKSTNKNFLAGPKKEESFFLVFEWLLMYVSLMVDSLNTHEPCFRIPGGLVVIH